MYNNKPELGNKHATGGDETPPIPEEELEQQKIEHERQMQKVKNLIIPSSIFNK